MADEQDRVIYQNELPGLVKRSRETIRVWMKKNLLPPPDVDISRRTRGWKKSTLVAAGICIL